MHTEVQVAPELHQRITDNATKLKAVVVEIIPPDTNLQLYDAFRESLTGNNAAMYKLLMKNLTTTARADSTLQNSLTKLQESYHSDAIVGQMSNPSIPDNAKTVLLFFLRLTVSRTAGHLSFLGPQN
mmetsp:Transcript_15469/g.19867  ORF Transcript_15469/g.19867 Transcript_15469/m.19867 type:complete len:127 (-) Transcript_15469:76-456(-)